MKKGLRCWQKRKRDIRKELSLFHPLHLQFSPVNQLVKSYFQKVKNNEIVCDFGCGDKPYQNYLPKMVRYVGIDIDKANTKADIFASVSKVPLPNNYADYVVSFFVLEHVDDPLKVLKEAYRVLKPGGELFIVFPLFWEEHEEPYDFFRFTRYGASVLLKRAGFKKIEIKPVNTIFAYAGIFISNKIGRFIFLKPVIFIINLFFKMMENVYLKKNGDQVKAVLTFSAKAKKRNEN